MRKVEDVKGNIRILQYETDIFGPQHMAGVIREPGGKLLDFCAGWDEDGKEHVSVSLADQRRFRRGELPTWDDMCFVKDIFWDEEEEVFQIHPPRSCYVDLGAILHLWRAKDGGEIHAEGYDGK